jgi:hypothetical protein
MISAAEFSHIRNEAAPVALLVRRQRRAPPPHVRAALTRRAASPSGLIKRLTRHGRCPAQRRLARFRLSSSQPPTRYGL